MASSISKCCFFTITAKSHSSTAFSQRPSSSISQFHSIIRSQTSYSWFLRHNKKIRSRYSTRIGCYGVPVIRASRVIETEKVPSDIRKRTMDAVDACGGRVTIGDVVSKAGINLNEAQKALQALAADTHGFLEIYAGSFFVIPFVRQFFILKTNAEIEKRNRAREQHAQALELPHLSLRRKLLSARDMANRTFIGQDRVVYTTGRDLIEQDFKD